MSNKNLSTKSVKLSDGTTIQVDLVFDEKKLDNLGTEFVFHNFPTPFDVDANKVLLGLLMIKHFTNYRFDGNLSKNLAQYEMLMERHDLPKILNAFNAKEKRKINDAVKNAAIHTANVMSFIGEKSPLFAAQMISKMQEDAGIE